MPSRAKVVPDRRRTILVVGTRRRRFVHVEAYRLSFKGIRGPTHERQTADGVVGNFH